MTESFSSHLKNIINQSRFPKKNFSSDESTTQFCSPCQLVYIGSSGKIETKEANFCPISPSSKDDLSFHLKSESLLEQERESFSERYEHQKKKNIVETPPLLLNSEMKIMSLIPTIEEDEKVPLKKEHDE